MSLGTMLTTKGHVCRGLLPRDHEHLLGRWEGVETVLADLVIEPPAVSIWSFRFQCSQNYLICGQL